MAKLDANQRAKLPAKDFGLPAQGKYPLEDKGHAIAAKGRAAQQVAKGNLSPAGEAKIDAKANRVRANGPIPDRKRSSFSPSNQ